MTLFYRRVLTLILFILLLIIGPALIFYGAGYRFDLKQKRLERVGLLHITTDPENTTITLDGQSHPVPDELVLTSLQPKEYDIVISKNDYHSWYKRLEILPGESTFIRELNLFLDSNPESIAAIPASASFLLTHGDNTYFQSADKLYRFSFSNEELTEQQLENDFSLIQTRGYETNQLTFQQNALWYFFNGETIEPISVQGFTEEIIDLQAHNGFFYFLSATGIWKTSIETAEEPQLISQQLFAQNIRLFDETIWFTATEPSKKHSFLYRISNEQSRPELIATLPYAQDYRFDQDFGGFVSLFAKEQEKLILVDANTLPPKKEEINHVKSWEWSQSNNQLLVATEFELIIFHFEEGQRQELLMRLSKPFSDTAWEEEEQHAFYISDNQLHLVERDERFQRNNFLLTEKIPGLELLFTTSNRRFVYLAQPNNEGGIEITKLQVRE